MKAKVFVGKEENKLQARFDDFFKNNPNITIHNALQSSSSHTLSNGFPSFQTTITIFYTDNVS